MKILEILNICETNAFRGRVSKLSQFNPSSQPNATAECTGYDYFKDDFKIKALSKINAGEEITIARCYFQFHAVAIYFNTEINVLIRINFVSVSIRSKILLRNVKKPVKRKATP